MVGKFRAKGHLETPSRLPAYPFSHYSNSPFKVCLDRGQFSGASLSSPSSRRWVGGLSSPTTHSPQPRPSPPPPRVSGPRDGGRRMADVRVSAASLTETVKGQEQCLGRPPAPPLAQSRRPRPSHRPPTNGRGQTSHFLGGGQKLHCSLSHKRVTPTL